MFKVYKQSNGAITVTGRYGITYPPIININEPPITDISVLQQLQSLFPALIEHLSKIQGLSVLTSINVATRTSQWELSADKLLCYYHIGSPPTGVRGSRNDSQGICDDL